MYYKIQNYKLIKQMKKIEHYYALMEINGMN